MTKNRLSKMIDIFSSAIVSGVKIIVITKPIEDYSVSGVTQDSKKERFIIGLKKIFEILKSERILIEFRSKIHQKFAIIDQKIVWYGSINLLSFGNSEESIMRLESFNIAYELMKSVNYVTIMNDK
jgi:phosphatidylserine/phosphatidylglycerophosphate/cardiolipin synthase-like enzyme